MSIKKSLLVTLLLLGVIHLTTLVDFKNYLEIIVVLFTYIILTLYTRGFSLKKNWYNPFQKKIIFKDFILIFLIVVFLFGSIYSLENVFNALVLGDTFTVNLKTHYNNLKNVVLSITLFPFFEELFFRKTILQGLIKHHSIRKSIIISSLRFSALFASYTVLSVLPVCSS